MLFPPSLQGLRLLQGASAKREEARKLEVKAESMEAEGWGKLREAVMGSKVEGLYGLLRGVTSSSCHLLSQPLPPQSCISPGPSISQQPPQESTEPKASDPVGPATVSAPVATTPAMGGNIPVDMQPLRIHLGAPRGYTSARLKAAKRAHPPHKLPFALTLGGYIWEWGWCAHFAANLSSTRTSLGITRKSMNKGQQSF